MKSIKPQKKSRIYIKAFVFILAYASVGYQIIHFDHWPELKTQLSNIPAQRYLFLGATILLMPLNWGLEVAKWIFLTAPIKRIDIKQAFISVYTGLAAGMITPAKLGDWPGRALPFEKSERFSILLIAQFNSLIKTLSISILGVLSWALYTVLFDSRLFGNKQLAIMAIALVLTSLLLFLYSKKFMGLVLHIFSKKKSDQAHSLTWISTTYRFKALAISTSRAAIFSIQFILLSRFFCGADFEPSYFLIAPIYFFILTYIPAFSLADPGIRASVSMLLFRNIEIQGPIMAIVGISLWMINTIVPLILGSFLRQKEEVIET